MDNHKKRDSITANGEELRRLRLLKGWSVDDLANHAGCDSSTVENVEKGNSVRISTIRKIASALSVSHNGLLSNPSPSELRKELKITIDNSKLTPDQINHVAIIVDHILESVSALGSYETIEISFCSILVTIDVCYEDAERIIERYFSGGTIDDTRIISIMSDDIVLNDLINWKIQSLSNSMTIPDEIASNSTNTLSDTSESSHKIYQGSYLEITVYPTQPDKRERMKVDMQHVRNCIQQAIQSAESVRMTGNLYWGSIRIGFLSISDVKHMYNYVVNHEVTETLVENLARITAKRRLSAFTLRIPYCTDAFEKKELVFETDLMIHTFYYESCTYSLIDYLRNLIITELSKRFANSSVSVQ